MGNSEDSFSMEKFGDVASRLLEVGFEPGDLARAFGVCPLLLLPGASAAGEALEVALAAFRPLSGILRLVSPMCGGDAARVARWLDEPNVAFHGIKPREMILMRKEADVEMFLRTRLDHGNRELFGG